MTNQYTGYMKKDKERLNLRKYAGQQKTFTARLTRTGDNKGKFRFHMKRILNPRNMLLEDIRLKSKSKNNEDNEYLSDHIWIDEIADLQGVSKDPPPLIQFTAKVVEYTKYNNRNKRILSWKLENLKHIKFIEITEQQKQQLILNGKRNLL